MATTHFYLYDDSGRRPTNSLESKYGGRRSELLGRFIVKDAKVYHDFGTLDEFIEYVATIAEPCFYEVIFKDNVQKLKFDIDIKIDQTDYSFEYPEDLDDILNTVECCFYAQYNIELMPNDIIITTSNRQNRYSHHIIINNYAVINSDEAAHFTKQVYEAIKNKNILDLSVNKSTQNFRLMGCCKSGIIGSLKRPYDYKNYCKLYTYEDTVIKFVDLCEVLPPKCCATARQTNPPAIYNGDIEPILKQIPPQYMRGHVFNKRIDNLLLFTRVAPSFCPICERTHDHENSLMVLCGRNNNISIKCRRNAKVEERIIYEGRRPNNAASEMQFDGSNIYNEPQLRPFEHGAKTLCVHAPMKIGKTNALIDFLATGNYKKVIFISFRQAFSANIKQRFSEFVLYKDVKGDLVQDKIIVQNESLYRIKISPGSLPPDLLILDESESIIEQFNSGLFKYFNESFAVFRWLMRYSRQLIAMDALLSARTVNVIKRMRAGDILYHCNTFKNATDAVYSITASKSVWYDALLSSATNNKKIVIVTNTLKEAEIIRELIVTKCPHKKLILYSSKSDGDKKKTHLRDVNKYWTQYEVLIYTPTISAGVSFEIDHFDIMYCYFVNLSCSAEICIQMMGRIRAVKNFVIYAQSAGPAFKLPETRADIKDELLRGRQNLYKSYCNNFIDFTYNERGEILINENDYFYLWLENIKVKNASINDFEGTLIRYIKATGAKIIYLRSEGPGGIQDVRAQMRSQIEQARAINILNADDITQEQAGELQKKLIDGLSVDDRHKYEKFKLKNIYGVEKLTMTFILNYSPINVQRHFKNLKKIYCERTVDKSLIRIQEDEANYLEYCMNNNIDTFYTRFNNYRVSIALLKVCGFSHPYDIKTYSSDFHITNNIKGCVALEDEIRLVCNNLLISYTGAIDEMANFIRQVNKIIDHMYGIEIKKEITDKVMYVLCQNKNFRLTADGEIVPAARPRPLIKKKLKIAKVINKK